MNKLNQLKYRETIFLIVGLIILTILILVAVWLISFLINRLNTATNPNLQPPAVTQFNIEEFKKLNLIPEEENSPTTESIKSLPEIIIPVASATEEQLPP